jgi:hypothetical protein
VCLFSRYKVLNHPTLAKLGYVLQEALPSIISQSYNYYTKTTIQKLKLVKTMFYIKNTKGTSVV